MKEEIKAPGLHELSIEMLGREYERAMRMLDDALLEIEQNPDEAAQDAAVEHAQAQLDALVALRKRMGELKRDAVESMRNDGETSRLDDPSIPSNRFSL